MTAADTLLSYQVNAQVGGKLAQLGARLIDASAKQMADTFFDRFSKEVQAMSPAAITDQPTEPAGASHHHPSRAVASGANAPPGDTDLGTDTTRTVRPAARRLDRWCGFCGMILLMLGSMI